MTFAGPIAEHGFATEYEQLRRGVLDGEAPTRHFGLVILMREGVAAWMAHASARPATVANVVGNGPLSVTAFIAENVHADMVAVLANMVMTNHEEKCA